MNLDLCASGIVCNNIIILWLNSIKKKKEKTSGPTLSLCVQDEFNLIFTALGLYRVTEVSLAFKDPVSHWLEMHFGQAVTNITLYHQMLNFTHWAFKLQVCWHVLSEYFTLLWRNNFPWHWALCVFWGVQDEQPVTNNRHSQVMTSTGGVTLD